MLVTPALVLMSLEGITGALSFPRDEEVVIVREISMPFEETRARLATGPDFDLEELPAFLKLGFPLPVEIDGTGIDLGDTWCIHFAGGEGKPGDLTATVVDSEPGHVRVVRTNDTSHIAHWLDWQEADWRISPTDKGTTTITLGLPFILIDSTTETIARFHPLWLGSAIVASIPGITAVRELSLSGHGTPVPLDPPRRLVTHGIYGYCHGFPSHQPSLGLSRMGGQSPYHFPAAAGIFRRRGGRTKISRVSAVRIVVATLITWRKLGRYLQIMKTTRRARRNQPSMKPIYRLLLCWLATFSTSSLAEEAKPLKALLITGGCCHDYKFQAEALQAGTAKAAKIEWTIVNEGGNGTDAQIKLYDNPEWAKPYDVVVHNECFADTKDPEYIRKITAAHKGGVPAVVIHCAMHSYRGAKIDDWREFLGVTSRRHEHQSRYPVKIAKKDHPIMKGFPEDWVTPMDELYVIEKTWPKTTVLATSASERDAKIYPVIWTNDYYGTRVFGTTYGHSNETFTEKAFLDLIGRGIVWATGSTDKAQSGTAPD